MSVHAAGIESASKCGVGSQFRSGAWEKCGVQRKILSLQNFDEGRGRVRCSVVW